MLAVKIFSIDFTHLNYSRIFASYPRMSISSFLGWYSNPVIPRSISLVGRDNPVAQDPNILKSAWLSTIYYKCVKYMRINCLILKLLKSKDLNIILISEK